MTIKRERERRVREGVADKTGKTGRRRRRIYRRLRNGRGGLAKDEITLLRREHDMVNKARTWALVGGALLFV